MVADVTGTGGRKMKLAVQEIVPKRSTATGQDADPNVNFVEFMLFLLVNEKQIIRTKRTNQPIFYGHTVLCMARLDSRLTQVFCVEIFYRSRRPSKHNKAFFQTPSAVYFNLTDTWRMPSQLPGRPPSPSWKKLAVFQA